MSSTGSLTISETQERRSEIPERENLDDETATPMDTTVTSEEQHQEEKSENPTVQPDPMMRAFRTRKTIVINSAYGNNIINDEADKSIFFTDNLGIVVGIDETEIAMAETAIDYHILPHQIKIKSKLIYAEGFPFRNNKTISLEDVKLFADKTGFDIDEQFTKQLQASGNNAILTEYENMSAGTIIQLDNPMGFIPAEFF